MTLIPLDIPAGFYRNGTDLEQAGRWRDGSLVRWRDNSLRPVGGWQERKTSFCTNVVRGMHAWESLDSTSRLAGGSHSELIVMTGDGTLADITPTNLASGREDAAVETGYGYGPYGRGFYGQPRQQLANSVPAEATTWSLDNWGEYLLACHYDDGRILEWTLGAGTEIVQNGNFSSNGTNWTYNASAWTFVELGGTIKARHSNTSDTGPLSQDGMTLKKDAIYEVKLTLAGNSSNVAIKVGIDIGGGSEVLFLDESENTQGNFTYNMIPTQDTTVGEISIENDDAYDAYTVDDVSIRLKNVAQPLLAAPTNNLGLVVTEERFIFALGAGGNPRKVQWCDYEDNTTWTPASTNQAGDIELQTAGQIMQGIRTRGQTLIITDTDAHTARYTGPPFVYAFERVGTACGAVSRKSAVDTDAGAFWMGQRAFFRFDGNSVQEVPCDVHDHVFGDMNTAQQSKIWSFANGQYGEIWWFYCSGDSTEIDRYVAYDYKEGHWLIGELSRTSGVQRGVFRYPFMAGHNADTDIYEHEVGLNVESASVFAETGPIMMGAGEQIGRVTDLIPDEKTQGDVNVTFKTRFYPNAAETTHGPFTPTNPTSVRFSGRQMRMRVEGAKLADWRVGNMRIDVKAGGKR
jgi:hypothetical protein